jgi:hypothetical protein
MKSKDKSVKKEEIKLRQPPPPPEGFVLGQDISGHFHGGEVFVDPQGHPDTALGFRQKKPFYPRRVCRY